MLLKNSNIFEDFEVFVSNSVKPLLAHKRDQLLIEHVNVEFYQVLNLVEVWSLIPSLNLVHP